MLCGRAKDAEDYANKGLTIITEDLVVTEALRQNLGHALLLQGRRNEAMEMYHSAPNAVLAEDFSLMRLALPDKKQMIDSVEAELFDFPK